MIKSPSGSVRVNIQTPIETQGIAAHASQWLAQFERALAATDDARLRALFHRDSHWRDVLALTWRLTTVDGADAILRALASHAARARPSGFAIDPERTAPRRVTRSSPVMVGCPRRIVAPHPANPVRIVVPVDRPSSRHSTSVMGVWTRCVSAPSCTTVSMAPSSAAMECNPPSTTSA